ncbi:MAG: hypothetical protein IPM99_25710 [Rubrivivax sp.]|nr:hypothetical protein [Rubrivivax sp.]
MVKGDVYYARYRIKNKRAADGQRYVTESLGTTDESIALDRARQRYAEIKAAEQANKAIKSGSVSAEIDAFIETYEDGVKKGLRRHSEHMLRGFRKSIVRYFKEYIGRKNIQDVTAQDLEEYEAWRHGYWAAKAAAGDKVHGNAKERPSQRTIEWEVGAFKQFLRWASERGRYNGNALTFKFTVDKKQARSAFTDEQLDTLANFTRRKSWVQGVGKHGHDARLTRYREMLRAYVFFMAGTGLRPGEARNLRWRDIKYTQGPTSRRQCMSSLKRRIARSRRSALPLASTLRRWRSACKVGAAKRRTTLATTTMFGVTPMAKSSRTSARVSTT